MRPGRAAWEAARDRYWLMRRTATNLSALGMNDQANDLAAQAAGLAEVEMPVEVECITCGGDCGITMTPDELLNGQLGDHGVCGDCVARIDDEVAAMARERKSR